MSSLPALFYVAITIAMTWPLAAGLARDVPGDLGDSLLNMWILGWGAESLPRVLTGSMSLADVWNANIFHPEPLALSFSEHLFGQVLQILPVYSSHRKSDPLLQPLVPQHVRSVGHRDVPAGEGVHRAIDYAAFIAGLLFAFVPYRVAQVAHIQSLSSQWMPLALYGFRRYIITSRPRALAGGTAALLMQNWSCGYYLIFFTPLVVLFVVHQLLAAGRARDWRAWMMFFAAAVAVAVGTWPFLSLYLEAQRVHGFERPLAEIVGFSADVFSYLTAPEALKLLGATLRAWPKPEGELFLGFVPTFLAAVAVYATVRERRASTTHVAPSAIVTPPRRLSRRRVAVLIFGAVALALAAAVVDRHRHRRLRDVDRWRPASRDECDPPCESASHSSPPCSSCCRRQVRNERRPRHRFSDRHRRRFACARALALARACSARARPCARRLWSLRRSPRSRAGLRFAPRPGPLRDDRGSLPVAAWWDRGGVAAASDAPCKRRASARGGIGRGVSHRGHVCASTRQSDVGRGWVDSSGARGTGVQCARCISAASTVGERCRPRGVPIRRPRVGTSLRLLLYGPLEAPRQWL